VFFEIPEQNEEDGWFHGEDMTDGGWIHGDEIMVDGKFTQYILLYLLLMFELTFDILPFMQELIRSSLFPTR
jgi:hypothetical protein